MNFVYGERSKYLALAESMLGRPSAATRVFRELVTAVDERQSQFANSERLEQWCWKAFRNRCFNLMHRGQPAATLLPKLYLDRLDIELRRRESREVADLGESLRPCLRELSTQAQWIVQLYYIERKNGLEASRMLNLSSVAFYRELQRIYGILRRALEKRAAMGSAAFRPDPARDTAFERLVFRYLDHQVEENGLQNLVDELGGDCERIQQFNDIRIYTALLRDTESLPAVVELVPAVTPGAYPKRRKRTWSWAISIATATATVAAAVGVFSLIQVKETHHVESPAIVLRGSEARFSGGLTPGIGDSLEAGTYELALGTVQLKFARGAEVNIEAPASFTIQSPQEMILHRGTSLATVPDSAIGFTIHTETASVVDLGTEFGVTVRPGKNTDVVVFKGTVEVERRSDPDPVLLTAGSGLRLTPDGASEALMASQEACHYPQNVPVSEGSRHADNLLENPSFENGSLSRAPHADHRYRDMASAWRPGRIIGKRWSDDVPVTAAGTAVLPSSHDPIAPFPHGERSLYLQSAAARQELKSLEPGLSHHLTVRAAAPENAKFGAAPDFVVGLMSREGRWFGRHRQKVTNNGEFETYHIDIDATKGADPETTYFLVLSVEQGPVYFDDLQLSEKPGADGESAGADGEPR